MTGDASPYAAIVTAPRVQGLAAGERALSEGGVEVWRGGVATWECDAMGHLNVGFYLAKCQESLAALAAARGAMLVGASLPPVYDRAASLARRIETLKATRAALNSRRLDAAKNAASLALAHSDLVALSAEKDREAAGAAEESAGAPLAAGAALLAAADEAAGAAD